MQKIVVKSLTRRISPEGLRLPYLLQPKERKKKKSLISRLLTLPEMYKILRMKPPGKKSMKEEKVSG